MIKRLLVLATLGTMLSGCYMVPMALVGPGISGFSTASLIQSGVTAIIQPAGSIKDKEIIKFANATGTVLIFSKTRHFRH